MSSFNRHGRDDAPPPALVGAMPISNALRLSRERYGMTVRQVAEKCKATPRDVDAWERAQSVPPPQSWTRLCSTFPWLRGWVGEAGVQLVHGARPDPVAIVEKLPKYTRMLVHEMSRAQMSIQAKSGRKGDGLAGLSGLSEARCEEIVLGAAVSEMEHRRIFRALPRMKAHGRLLLEFATPVDRAPPPRPPRVVHDVEPRSESVPPPREVTGPDAPPPTKPEVQVVIGTSPSVPTIEEAMGPTMARSIEKNYATGGPVLVVDAPSTKPALTIKPRTFGEHLRALREREGMTQVALGEVFDVDGTTVSNWETGYCKPIRPHLEKLLQLFPELADAPKYDARNMVKPGGAPRDSSPVMPVEFEHRDRTGAVKEKGVVMAQVETLPGPTVTSVHTSPTTDPMALVRFGLALGEFRTAVKSKAADAVVRLLRAGAAAGLSVESIAVAVENRGR